MLLLVSVRSASEVSPALAGGADVIDAKDPAAGALGAVTIEQLREVHLAVDGRRPLSAALGDATSPAAIERDARAYAAAGADLVKVGFAGIGKTSQIADLVSAAVRGAKDGSEGKVRVVAVIYADADSLESAPPAAFIDGAANAGAAGMLVDTSNKTGAGLRALLSHDALSALVREGQQRGMFVALAGKLTPLDLPFVRDTGADIAGVRGAACAGGRNGRVTIGRVRQLRALCSTPIDLEPFRFDVVSLKAHAQAPSTCNAERSSSRRSAGTTTGVT